MSSTSDSFKVKLSASNSQDEEKKKAFIQKISEDITYRETDNRFKLDFGFVKENEEGVEVVLTNAEIIEEYYK